MPDTILIVDDLPDWRSMLAGLIGDFFPEIQVIAAASMEEAISCLDEHSFRLAIIDIRLDDSDEKNEDGLELAEYIHNHFKKIPILILTGYPSLETVEQAMKPDKTGVRLALDYIEKNNMNEELLTRVAKILKKDQ